MKITNWTMICSFVSVMAVSSACGTQQPIAEETNKALEVKPLEAADHANLNDVIVKVVTDENGKPISTEVRSLRGKNVTLSDEQAAEAAFNNADTATDDSSADSFYAGCGAGYSSSYTSYSSSYNDGCGNYGATNYTNYNSQWNNPGFAYQPTNYTQSSYYSSYSSSSYGYPVAQGYPVYGCQSVGCYNGAYGYWPSYYKSGYATPIRNFLFGYNNYYPTPIRNFLFGYRYPYARAYAGNNCTYYQYPAW